MALKKSILLSSILFSSYAGALEIPVDGTTRRLNESPVGGTAAKGGLFGDEDRVKSSSFSWGGVCSQKQGEDLSSCHDLKLIETGPAEFRLASNFKAPSTAQVLLDMGGTFTRELEFTLMGRDPLKTYQIHINQKVKQFTPGIRKPNGGFEVGTTADFYVNCFEGFNPNPAEGMFLFTVVDKEETLNYLSDGVPQPGFGLELTGRLLPGQCQGKPLKVGFSMYAIHALSLGDFEITILQEGEPVD